MRWKSIIIGLFLFLFFGTVLGTVVYYKIDWSELTHLSFYENLANPYVRIVRVPEGLRKEQIAEVMAGKLGWDESEKTDFINAHLALNTTNREGRYFPKTYILGKDDSPAEVSGVMFQQFSKETATIKKPKSTKILNPDTVLKIASIIQREAAGKEDMRLISGIIWN